MNWGKTNKQKGHGYTLRFERHVTFFEASDFVKWKSQYTHTLSLPVVHWHQVWGSER